MVELCNQMFLKNVDVVEDDICILKVIKLLILIRAEPCMWIAYKIILRSAKKTIASSDNQDSRATMVIWARHLFLPSFWHSQSESGNLRRQLHHGYSIEFINWFNLGKVITDLFVLHSTSPLWTAFKVMHTPMYIYIYAYTHTGNWCEVKQNLSWMLQTCFLDYDAIYNIESARRSPFIVSWKPLSSRNPKFNWIWKNRSAHRNSNFPFPLFVHWKVKEAMFGLQSSWWPSTAAFMLKVDRHSDAQFLWVSELFYKGGNIECKIDSDCQWKSVLQNLD